MPDIRTLHTGNRQHRTQADSSQIYRAKLYAQDNGFGGARGGWIYNRHNQHVAHGWSEFYHAYRSEIEANYARRKAARQKRGG